MPTRTGLCDKKARLLQQPVSPAFYLPQVCLTHPDVVRIALGRGRRRKGRKNIDGVSAFNRVWKSIGEKGVAYGPSRSS
jgi:hypothetical protein